MKKGVCPICGNYKDLSRHHIHKFTVFHDDSEQNIFYICEKCHNQGAVCLEALITERENDLLRKYPELYEEALMDYIDGIRPKKYNYKRRVRHK
jgi:5-methylcytosine-specific restriction endonuclease McrA